MRIVSMSEFCFQQCAPRRLSWVALNPHSPDEAAILSALKTVFG